MWVNLRNIIISEKGKLEHIYIMFKTKQTAYCLENTYIWLNTKKVKRMIKNKRQTRKKNMPQLSGIGLGKNIRSFSDIVSSMFI